MVSWSNDLNVFSALEAIEKQLHPPSLINLYVNESLFISTVFKLPTKYPIGEFSGTERLPLKVICKQYVTDRKFSFSFYKIINIASSKIRQFITKTKQKLLTYAYNKKRCQCNRNKCSLHQWVARCFVCSKLVVKSIFV